MRKISGVEITLGQTAAGAGTATSAWPISGEVVEVRMDAAGTIIASGTADFTITRSNDGGTILSAANQTAPFEYHPRRAVHSDSAGTTAYAAGAGPVYDAGGGIPVDGYVQVVWAQGNPAAGTATLWVYVREQ